MSTAFPRRDVLFGVGSVARSASKSDPSPRIATHCIDELIVCPTRVTVGSRLGVKSQADSQLNETSARDDDAARTAGGRCQCAAPSSVGLASGASTNSASAAT
jgi:hypothetical protein